MNPADPPVDDPLGEELAIYDERLAADRSQSAESGPQLPSAGTMSPDMHPRLRRLQDVLRRLDHDRRREQTSKLVEPPFRNRIPGQDTCLEVFEELGRFQILRELGQGGFGIVFLAWDPKLQRKVALKLPRPETLLSAEHRHRFVREAQTAAGLDHPGIVPVHEAGEIGPIWYIASAYCDGSTLADWLKDHAEPVRTRSAAELLAKLAEAMQYTHSRGVVHRDLKPSNILLPSVTAAESPRTTDFGQPKITDFGLAKLLEHQGDETRSGLLMGTPAYMAPEQAEGRLREVGPATDVYSLGVILYELLTGQAPFGGRSDLDTLRQIGVGEAVAPSRLRPGLPRDLEAICLKCLEKSPQRRYPLAGELAEDLRRFLDDKPTLARPLSTWQRAVKWSRRRPALATLVGVVVVAVLSLSSLGTWHMTQLHSKNLELQAAVEEAGQQRGLAERGERHARREAYAAHMARAGELWDRGHTGLLAELLTGLRPAPGEEDLRGFAWHYLWRMIHKERFLRGHNRYVHAVAFSPDDKFCASGSEDRTVKLWDVATGKLHASLEGHTASIVSVAFSPDGKQLAAAGWQPGEVKLWEVATGRPLADLTGPMSVVEAVAFSPDGRALAIAGGTGGIGDKLIGVIRMCELRTGQARFLIECPAICSALVYSADGRYLAAACGRLIGRVEVSDIHVWDLTTGTKEVLLSGDPYFISCLAFAPDGKFIASAGSGARNGEGIAQLWDVKAGKEALLHKSGVGIRAIAFSPDGQSLLTVARDHKFSTLDQWDVALRSSRSPPTQLDYSLGELTFSPDGQTLALACDDHLVRLWKLSADPEFISLPGHRNEAWAVAFSPDNRTLASASDDHTIKLWEYATRQLQATLEGHDSLVSHVTFSPNGRWLASASYDQTVKLWDAETGEVQTIFQGHAQAVRCVAFSPDGRILASAGKDQVVRLWDVATGREGLQLLGHSNQIRGLVFAPNGRTLVSASEDRTIRFWNTATGEQLRQLNETSEVWSLAISADGQMLASGNKDSLVKLWEVATGKERSVLRGHTGGVRSLAFTADGRTLASGSVDRTIRLWQPATGHELLCFKVQTHEVNSVAFSDDGQMLAAALHDGEVRLWTAPIGPAD